MLIFFHWFFLFFGKVWSNTFLLFLLHLFPSANFFSSRLQKPVFFVTGKFSLFTFLFLFSRRAAKARHARAALSREKPKICVLGRLLRLLFLNIKKNNQIRCHNGFWHEEEKEEKKGTKPRGTAESILVIVVDSCLDGCLFFEKQKQRWRCVLARCSSCERLVPEFSPSFL